MRSRRDFFEQQHQDASAAIDRLREYLFQVFKSEASGPAYARMDELKSLIDKKLPPHTVSCTSKDDCYVFDYQRAYLLTALARTGKEKAAAAYYLGRIRKEALRFYTKSKLPPAVRKKLDDLQLSGETYVDQFSLPVVESPAEQEYFRLYAMRAVLTVVQVFDQQFRSIVNGVAKCEASIVDSYSYLIERKVEEEFAKFRRLALRSDPVDEDEIPRHFLNDYDTMRTLLTAEQRLAAYDYLCDNGFPEQLADLPEFLDINAEIDACASNSTQYVFRTDGPAYVDHWRKHQAQIEHFLDQSVGIDLVGADMISIRPRPSIPDVIPLTTEHRVANRLFFGYDVLASKPYYVNLADMTHMLVAGISGMGKSVFLNQLIQGFLFNIARIDAVFLVDLKGGVELFPYEKASDRIHVIYQMENLYEVVSSLLRILHKRLDWMREHGHRKWPGHHLFFVVDEYAQIQLYEPADKEDKNRHRGLLNGLNKLSTMGRAVGIRIIAQLQKATTDVMDSSFRNNLQSKACFRVSNNLTTASVFGSSDDLPADALTLKRGQFILYDDSQAQTVVLQACMVPEGFDRC